MTYNRNAIDPTVSPQSAFPNSPKAPSPVNTSTATVATPSAVYDYMHRQWSLVEDLRGGTEVMRARGRARLPQEPRESPEAYSNRLQRTFLFNLYKRTLYAITGLAFVKSVSVDNVPPELEYLEHNADGTGRSLTELCYDFTIDAVHYGKTHALCDFPQVDSQEMSHAQFMQSGYRPYITHINPRNLIGWRSTDTVGIPVLQQVRVTESKIAPSDINEYADKTVYYVRVFKPGSVEVHEYDPEFENASYQIIDDISQSIPYIPITTAYGNKTGFMEATPAMMDLAWINLRHYQSSSDQNNILHVARVPFLFASGFDEGELENAEIGASRMIVSSNPDSDIKHVEHSGKAIGAGRQDLIDLENQMAALGADMLVSKGVSRMTATARRLDQNESMSTLQLALRSVENMVEQLYKIAGDWIGVDASNVVCSIGEDMSVANEPNPTNALKTLLDTGLLTDKQVVESAKRQGILASNFNLAEDRPRNLPGFFEDDSEEYSEDGSEEENLNLGKDSDSNDGVFSE